MVKIEDRVFNDLQTSEYLEKHCKIAKTSPQDLNDIASILVYCFNIPKMYNTRMEDVYKFMYDTKFDIYNSVKLYDPSTNRIYGILMVGERSLHESSPAFMRNKFLYEALKDYNQINGIGFLIDERLRGKGFDKKMMIFNKEYFDKFDLIWHGVDKSLHTHNYWKRFGFSECFDDGHVKFYTKFLD